MNMQPALDHINAESARRGLNPLNAEMEMIEDDAGDGVTLRATFADGSFIDGYAPNGKVDLRASLAAQRQERRPQLHLVTNDALKDG